MKRILIGLIVGFAFISCQDVIDVDLSSENPRLIIDALIRVDSNQATTNVVIKVSETSSFFETIPAANLQQITLINLDLPEGSTNPPELIEEEPGTGIYSKVFATEYLLTGRLFLQVDFEDKIFVATAQFIPTVPIDTITQGDGILFHEGDTEVIMTYTDYADREDFYLFDFDFGNFLVTQDEFYQGQEFKFSYFYDGENDKLEPGDVVEISVMGIDEDFFNYMDQLILQSEEGFGPFDTPALTVRGNFINVTDINNIDNLNNFALGYFAIAQEYKNTLIIE